jgi:hypothetical protein
MNSSDPEHADYDPFPSDSSDEEKGDGYAHGDGTSEWFKTPVPAGVSGGGGSGGSGGGGSGVGARRLHDDERDYHSLVALPTPAQLARLACGPTSPLARVPGAPRIGARRLAGAAAAAVSAGDSGGIVAGDGHWHSVVTRGEGEAQYYSMGALRVRGAEHAHGDVGLVEQRQSEKWRESDGLMDGNLDKGFPRCVEILVRTVESRIDPHAALAVAPRQPPPPGAPLTPAGELHDDALFDSTVRINLNLAEYVRRIVGATKMPIECLLIASMYIDRLCNKAGLVVTDANRHGVVLTAMMMATKMYEDIPWANSYWSALSGTFPVSQINQMELYIVKGLAFNLTIKCLAFQEYAKLALAISAEGKK